MWESTALAVIPSLPWGAGPLSALTVLCEEVQAWTDTAGSFRPARLPFTLELCRELAPANSSSLTGAGRGLTGRAWKGGRH